jgi:hypothetical protein
MHGFGTKKSYIRDNRDAVIRFMKAYLEGIYVFKTNKELALNVLKKYTRVDDVSLMQDRLPGNVPTAYPQRSSPEPGGNSDHSRSTRQRPPGDQKIQAQRTDRSEHLEGDRGQRIRETFVRTIDSGNRRRGIPRGAAILLQVAEVQMVELRK